MKLICTIYISNVGRKYRMKCSIARRTNVLNYLTVKQAFVFRIHVLCFYISMEQINYVLISIIQEITIQILKISSKIYFCLFSFFLGIMLITVQIQSFKKFIWQDVIEMGKVKPITSSEVVPYQLYSLFIF
ncbi:hypothetical protein RJT34_29136 [Clitoria ternatea]|uniref:Uncharacterized protein n=1 Tax=Clitoria ternatea TaxID=43366 RepID=A0AAN9F9P7_CLITE